MRSSAEGRAGEGREDLLSMDDGRDGVLAGDAGTRRNGRDVAPLTLAMHHVVSVAGILLGIWVCWRALALTYYTPLGPGPGFFPLWLGLLMAVFSCVVLVYGLRDRTDAGYELFLPPGRRSEVLTTLAAIIAFAFLVERLGFALTMFGVLVCLLLVRGCRLFPTAIGIALLGSFGVALAFTKWLGVFLPPAPGGIFRFMGL
jgi:putative tricarboxylic transport membrane protein